MALIKKFRIKSYKNNKPLVKLQNISLAFGNRKILENISFNIDRGSILGLLGPNGVGKSTIFNLIMGLIKPDYGKILFDNQDATNLPVYERATKFSLGFCPQKGGFFGDLTLMENLNAIGEILVKDDKERISKIDKLIAKFELDSVRNIKASLLSGGQQKKLIIALALIGDPKILLLDEPFAALDILTIKMLQEIIVNLQTEGNIGVVLCDHQAKDLLSCVDYALVLSNTKIIAQGSPSQLINNVEAKSAYFGDSFKFN